MTKSKPPRERKSVLARDLDALGAIIKRAATIGAVLGYLAHHVHCSGVH